MLLPKTPPQPYPKKRIWRPKTTSLHFFFTFHSKDGGRRSIAGIALHSIPSCIKVSPFSKIFPLISSISAKIELTFNFPQEIPLKINRTERKGSTKNWNHLQFYIRNPFENESDQKKSYYNKRPWGNFLLWRPFFQKLSPNGYFWKSSKFLQLLPNLTPIGKLLCTFLYQCCYYPRPPL